MKHDVDDLISRLSDVGGFDEYAELCSDARHHLIRLRDKCNMQATILQRLTPDHYPGILFVHAEIGNRDMNNMPEELLVTPSYGCDFSYVYKRTDKTTGPEW